RTCADDGQYAPSLTDTADESPQPIRPPTSYHVDQERFCGQIGPMVQSSETDRALNAGQSSNRLPRRTEMRTVLLLGLGAATVAVTLYSPAFAEGDAAK